MCRCRVHLAAILPASVAYDVGLGDFVVTFCIMVWLVVCATWQGLVALLAMYVDDVGGGASVSHLVLMLEWHVVGQVVHMVVLVAAVDTAALLGAAMPAAWSLLGRHTLPLGIF